MDEAREASRLALLARIRAYMQQHCITKSEFGMLAVNSPSLVFNIEKGSWVRPHTLTRITNTLAYPPPARQAQPRFTAQATRNRMKAQAYQREALAEAIHRDTDTIEQAKRHLRVRGFNVFAASVLFPKDRIGICVGRLYLSPKELVAMAERHGFTRGRELCPASLSAPSAS